MGIRESTWYGVEFIIPHGMNSWDVWEDNLGCKTWDLDPEATGLCYFGKEAPFQDVECSAQCYSTSYFEKINVWVSWRYTGGETRYSTVLEFWNAWTKSCGVNGKYGWIREVF